MNTITIALGAERGARRAFNAIVKVADFIRTWRENRQAARREQAERETAARFDIEQRDGRMFITCDGVAFVELEGGCTVNEAADYLRDARQNACLFKSLTRY